MDIEVSFSNVQVVRGAKNAEEAIDAVAQQLLTDLLNNGVRLIFDIETVEYDEDTEYFIDEVLDLREDNQEEKS